MFWTRDPRNNQKIAEYNYMDWEQIEKMIQSSQEAYIGWRQLLVARKKSLMMSFADLLERNVEELASLISSEMGKLHHEAEAEVKKCAFLARSTAENIETWLTPKEIHADGERHLLKLEPIGVTFAIMPWNFPFWQVLRAAIPSILGGNVVLLKHAESTTGCGLRLAKLFEEAGFPPFIFQTIICDHANAAKVIAHPAIRLVSFTGSSRGGRAIGKMAGENLKKCILELGGSDPFIVLEDADLEKAVTGAVLGRFLNAGQVCISSKRFIVHKNIADRFIERLIDAAKKLQIAPLVNQAGLEQIERQVADAAEQGGEILCGGRRQGEGLHFLPTLIGNTKPSMAICREEVFGPVAPIIIADTIQEMIDLANATEFGLGASVWTQDLKRGQEIAEQLDCGATFINSIVKSDPRVPFGGVKNSGFGVEMTEYGLYEVMNLKSYNIYR